MGTRAAPGLPPASAAPPTPAAQAPSAAPAVTQLSASYGDLTLGLDPRTGDVTGYFDSATGLDERTQRPMFTCTFYLRGTLKDDAANIATWFPADRAEFISGTLTVAREGGNVGVAIALQREHGGCWNVMHFADSKPAVFNRLEPGDWTAVRIVAAERAHFFQEPRAPSVEKAYVVRGDAVVVLAAAPGWVRARKGQTEGWLRATDLYSDVAPAPPERGHERSDGSARGDRGTCDPDLVWDTMARECRMVPDGPYGWAGCTISRTAPSGAKCVTGAHWRPCTCECDAAMRFDATSNTCR